MLKARYPRNPVRSAGWGRYTEYRRAEGTLLIVLQKVSFINGNPVFLKKGPVLYYAIDVGIQFTVVLNGDGLLAAIGTEDNVVVRCSVTHTI